MRTARCGCVHVGAPFPREGLRRQSCPAGAHQLRSPRELPPRILGPHSPRVRSPSVVDHLLCWGAGSLGSGSAAGPIRERLCSAAGPSTPSSPERRKKPVKEGKTLLRVARLSLETSRSEPHGPQQSKLKATCAIAHQSWNIKGGPQLQRHGSHRTSGSPSDEKQG